MTSQIFLAKNTGQAPVSRLDKGRGNSLVCYIKKKRKKKKAKDRFLNKEKKMLGQKMTATSSSLCKLKSLKRAGGRE